LVKCFEKILVEKEILVENKAVARTAFPETSLM